MSELDDLIDRAIEKKLRQIRQDEEPKPWSHYQELRKGNKNFWYDRKMQERMVRDYQLLGNDFEDGDFHNA